MQNTRSSAVDMNGYKTIGVSDKAVAVTNKFDMIVNNIKAADDKTQASSELYDYLAQMMQDQQYVYADLRLIRTKIEYQLPSLKSYGLDVQRSDRRLLNAFLDYVNNLPTYSDIIAGRATQQKLAAIDTTSWDKDLLK